MSAAKQALFGLSPGVKPSSVPQQPSWATDGTTTSNGLTSSNVTTLHHSGEVNASMDASPAQRQANNAAHQDDPLYFTHGDTDHSDTEVEAFDTSEPGGAAIINQLTASGGSPPPLRKKVSSLTGPADLFAQYSGKGFNSQSPNQAELTKGQPNNAHGNRRNRMTSRTKSSGNIKQLVAKDPRDTSTGAAAAILAEREKNAGSTSLNDVTNHNATNSGATPPEVPQDLFDPLQHQEQLLVESAAQAQSHAHAIRRLATLSPQEQARMRDVFRKYDTESKGSIDATKLPLLLHDIGHPMPVEQAMDLLRQVDDNNNGQLEFEELLQMVLIFKGVAQFRIYESRVNGNSTQQHISKAMEKFKTILPDAMWMWIWDLTMLIVYAYLFCSVTSVYMAKTVGDAWHIMDRFFGWDIAVTVPLFLEMVVMCFKSYNNGQVMSQDTEEIMRHYLRTWFIPDLLSLLPLRLFVGREDGDGDEVVGRMWAMVILSHVRLCRVPRIARLFEGSGHVGMTRLYITFHFVFAPIAVQVISLLCCIHVLAVIWVQVLSKSVSYGTGVYISMYFISGVGYGTYEEESMQYFWWSNFCCLMALFINAAVVGNVVAIMNQADVEGTRQNKLVQTQAVLRFFDVPTPLEEEILQFQNHVLERDIHKSYGSLVESLPLEIRANLQMQLHLHLLEAVPVFRLAHETVQIALVQHFRQVVCCPEDYIVVSGEVAEDMIFIHYGFVDLLDSNGVYLTTLRNGEPFGDAIIFAPRDCLAIHEYSAKCLGYSELLVLSTAHLYEVFDLFPRFTRELEEWAADDKQGQYGEPIVSNAEGMSSAEHEALAAEIREKLSAMRRASCDQIAAKLGDRSVVPVAKDDTEGIADMGLRLKGHRTEESSVNIILSPAEQQVSPSASSPPSANGESCPAAEYAVKKELAKQSARERRRTSVLRPVQLAAGAAPAFLVSMEFEQVRANSNGNSNGLLADVSGSFDVGGPHLPDAIPNNNSVAAAPVAVSPSNFPQVDGQVSHSQEKSQFSQPSHAGSSVVTPQANGIAGQALFAPVDELANSTNTDVIQASSTSSQRSHQIPPKLIKASHPQGKLSRQNARDMTDDIPFASPTNSVHRKPSTQPDFPFASPRVDIKGGVAQLLSPRTGANSLVPMGNTATFVPGTLGTQVHTGSGNSLSFKAVLDDQHPSGLGALTFHPATSTSSNRRETLLGATSELRDSGSSNVIPGLGAWATGGLNIARGSVVSVLQGGPAVGGSRTSTHDLRRSDELENSGGVLHRSVSPPFQPSPQNSSNPNTDTVAVGEEFNPDESMFYATELSDLVALLAQAADLIETHDWE